MKAKKRCVVCIGCGRCGEYHKDLQVITDSFLKSELLSVDSICFSVHIPISLLSYGHTHTQKPRRLPCGALITSDRSDSYSIISNYLPEV